MIYIYIYIYINTHAHTQVHTHARARTHTYLHTYHKRLLRDGLILRGLKANIPWLEQDWDRNGHGIKLVSVWDKQRWRLE